MDYKLPAQTRIGHIHLKVSDLDKASHFITICWALKSCSGMARRLCLFLPGISSSYRPQYLVQ